MEAAAELYLLGVEEAGEYYLLAHLVELEAVEVSRYLEAVMVLLYVQEVEVEEAGELQLSVEQDLAAREEEVEEVGVVQSLFEDPDVLMSLLQLQQI